MKADLHIHSTVSDGSHTAVEIIDAAANRGIKWISLTEHDTTEGFHEARGYGKSKGVTVIPGIEFSAYDYVQKIRAHILGYGMRNFAPLDALGQDLLRRRHENSLKQIETLQNLGYDITVEDIAKKAGRHIYKQHIMDVMVEKGYADAIGGETFKRLFKNGGPCDFDIAYIDAYEAVHAVRDAGGVAVLAHPGQQGNYSSICGLRHAGLSGVELEHHANSQTDKKCIREYARCYGLFLTGGSDHHGLYENNSPQVGDFVCPEQTILYFIEQGLC